MPTKGNVMCKNHKNNIARVTKNRCSNCHSGFPLKYCFYTNQPTTHLVVVLKTSRSSSSRPISILEKPYKSVDHSNSVNVSSPNRHVITVCMDKSNIWQKPSNREISAKRSPLRSSDLSNSVNVSSPTRHSIAACVDKSNIWQVDSSRWIWMRFFLGKST